MPEYNGHKNYNYWNVALRIGNDESLYRLAVRCVRTSGNLTTAAHRFLSVVGQLGGVTPDGIEYTFGAVKTALSGIKKCETV